jgi:hypothetical protein
MSQSFFEISGEIIACEFDETERQYGRPSPTGLSSLLMMDTETPEGFSRSEKQPAGPTGGSPDDIEGNEKWAMRSFASGLVRVGTIGLMVPDPIPFVDELIFGGMIVVGVALHSTTW